MRRQNVTFICRLVKNKNRIQLKTIVLEKYNRIHTFTSHHYTYVLQTVESLYIGTRVKTKKRQRLCVCFIKIQIFFLGNFSRMFVTKLDRILSRALYISFPGKNLNFDKAHTQHPSLLRLDSSTYMETLMYSTFTRNCIFQDIYHYLSRQSYFSFPNIIRQDRLYYSNRHVS